jgi:DNA-binding SARP family transcriptional activator
LEFGVLGPLSATQDGVEIPLGPAKQRALLALLLLRRNRLVGRERLIEELWAGRPPPAAPKALNVYISGLRKVLEDGRLETDPGGYVLYTRPEELDAERFEALVREARAAEPGEKLELLERALSLWRGDPLADLRYVDFAQTEIGRLEELHLAALEERAEAMLALGRHRELAPELEALAAAHPLRERLRGQLMVGLYRSGRQAEALDSYRLHRQMLSRELGLEPARSLQDLEAQILRRIPRSTRPGRLRAPRGTGVARMALPPGPPFSSPRSWR